MQRVEIEIPQELVNLLQCMAGCRDRRRLEALASQLIIQRLRDRS